MVFWSFGTEIAAIRLVKRRSRVELDSTGSDRVVLGLRLAATLMEVSVGRGTLKWVRLREIRHKNDVNERPETLATSSMERALVCILIVIIEDEEIDNNYTGFI